MSEGRPSKIEPPAGMDARWLWVNLDRALPKDAIYNFSNADLGITVTPGLAYQWPAPITHLKYLGIPQGYETHSYNRADRCIYCNAKRYADGIDRDFGAEHIVPNSLGAQAIIPAASCQRHERITSAIETKILQRLFDPTRKHKDIRGKDRRPLLRNNFRVFRTVNGVHVDLPLPITEHPTALFLPRLAPPGIFTGRPPYMHGVIGIWLSNINATAEVIKRQNVSSYSTPVVDTLTFAQMIAKVGHAYACAELSLENFEPMLVDFIEMDTEDIQDESRRYQYFGGDVAVSPPLPYLHELGLFLYSAAGKTYAVAKIRLFAYLGAPHFYVVVGIVPEARRQDAMARLSQNNSRTKVR